jgi:asparagine synthase (glutamine-hydrolysing)
MNAIFGIVHFDGRPVSRERMDAVADRMRVRPAAPASVAIRIDGSVGMGHISTHAATEAGPDSFPLRHPDTGVFLSGAVSLYDRGALTAALGRTEVGTPGPSLDARLLIDAYLRWDAAFPSHVRGEFALAVWDPRARALLLARDHLGCAPCFYARHGDTVAFASTMGGVLAALEDRGRFDDLDPEWVANLVAGNRSDPELTPYAGIRRVQAGHVHREDTNGSSRSRYWSLQPGTRLALSDDREYEDAFREKLVQAVRMRMPESSHPVGAELSGGLDSSAVTALAAEAARARGVPLYSLCHVLQDHGQSAGGTHRDERDWAEALRCHAGIEHHVPISADGYGVLDSLRDVIRVQGAPVGTHFGVFSDALYDRAAAQGVRGLFSGFGGDEMVSSPASLVLEGWLARGEWRRVLDEMRARGRAHAGGSRLSLLRSLARLWTGRTRHRWMAANGDTVARGRLAVLPIRRDYATQWQLPERATAGWRALAAATVAADTRTYERHRIMHASVAERLEWCNIAAGARGLEYRHPLLDVPLLEFFHAVPDEQKWRAGWGRYLFRRAIQGFVPDGIRWRVDKQGTSIPHSSGRFASDAQALTELLARVCRRPELDFLDFTAVERDKRSLFGFSDGQQNGPAPLRSLLGLMVYWDMRAGGWRP